MDGNKRSQPKFDRNQIRVPEKKTNEVDKKYLEAHPGYKPGVWMRNPDSLSNIQNGQDKDKKNSINQDRIIEEEIDRYINDYNREKKESTRDLKAKISNDIRQREKILEDLKKNEEEAAGNNRDDKRRTDIEEERRKIEKLYQKMREDDLEKQRQLTKERQKMNDLIRRRIEEQDRLLDMERKEIEERNARMLNEEKLKNDIERKKLDDLKKQREDLLKQELDELTQIEKHEKKKKLIEEELKRSIKEREAEKERLADLNKRIDDLRQKEIEELGRIKSKEEDVARRRKQLMDDAFPNRNQGEDEVIEVWPCAGKDSKMCIVDPANLCVDPISGKLVIRSDLLANKESQKRRQTDKPGVQPSDNSMNYKTKDKVLTKQRYVELLSTYDPKKLRRKLSYQNWLMNDSNLDEGDVVKRFTGSDFSLQVDMAEWPLIKQESMKRYAALKDRK